MLRFYSRPSKRPCRYFGEYLKLIYSPQDIKIFQKYWCLNVTYIFLVYRISDIIIQMFSFIYPFLCTPCSEGFVVYVCTIMRNIMFGRTHGIKNIFVLKCFLNVL